MSTYPTKEAVLLAIKELKDYNHFGEGHVVWTCLYCQEVVMEGEANTFPEEAVCPGCGKPHGGPWNLYVRAPLFDG